MIAPVETVGCGRESLPDFDLSVQPSLRREQIDSLHALGLLEHRGNLLFLGPHGMAKTHLEISLAEVAESGCRTYFATLRNLIDSLEQAHIAGRLKHRLNALTPAALLVVDERLFLRHGEWSESVLPADHQRVRTRADGADVEKAVRRVEDILRDQVMAAALLDRLLHRCHIVIIRGNSFRLGRYKDLSNAFHPTSSRATDEEQAQMRETS